MTHSEDKDTDTTQPSATLSESEQPFSDDHKKATSLFGSQIEVTGRRGKKLSGGDSLLMEGRPPSRKLVRARRGRTHE